MPESKWWWAGWSCSRRARPSWPGSWSASPLRRPTHGRARSPRSWLRLERGRRHVGRGLTGDRIDQRGPRRLLLESYFVGERRPPVCAGDLLHQPPAFRAPLEPALDQRLRGRVRVHEQPGADGWEGGGDLVLDGEAGAWLAGVSVAHVQG